MRDLETSNYKLAVGTGAGNGTFIIVRNSDDFTTLRNTGSAAEDDFKAFERDFNISGSAFDAKCSLLRFEE